jgi:2-phosphoglycerate kinase
MIHSFLEQLFSKAYILGGSPCSGKSTIAEMISAQYGFPYYKADDHESDHRQRAQLEHQPVMFTYSKMGWDEIWSQAPERLLADELAYYHERFEYILDDFDGLNLEKPVILEGAAFLPELINPYPLKCANVVFMVPTIKFQLQHYSQRPWIQSVLHECHDPKQAFENWMKRDELFGQEVTHQANTYGFRVIVVDGSVSIQEQFEIIKTQFKLGNHKQTYLID